VALPRLHLFEFNDQAWVPAPLRDTIVESLTRALRWGRMLDGLVEPLLGFLDAAGAREVLDIGSGGGGPAEALVEAAHRRGRDLHVLLTDLYPRPSVWSALGGRHPGVIDFANEPVDATRIPPHLSAGRARVIINTFHHFQPDLAQAVMTDAIRSRAPIFVSEAFDRNPLRFLSFAPAGLAALYVSPALSSEARVARAALVWGSPVALTASVWDGLVSTMRVYTEEELRTMAGHDPSYRWTYGRYPFAPFGLGYYFHGIPGERA
jgi:hypothetical protein